MPGQRSKSEPRSTRTFTEISVASQWIKCRCSKSFSASCELKKKTVLPFISFGTLNVPTGSKSDQLKEWRMSLVPFGATSNPFLLSATIQNHLDKIVDKIANHLKSSFYVDNLLTGSDCKEDALNIYKRANYIMSNAGMTLCLFD